MSIIIPVYNTAKQLRRCLNSIVTQLNDKVEVILINDGSTDNSISIIHDYIEHYNQLKLYDKPNEGVSSSRNIGLKVAVGQYVAFVDSDDYVENDYICKMLANIQKMELDKLDLMIFGFYRREGENYSVNSPMVRKNESDIIKDIFVQKYNAPWNKIFKKSIIDTYKLEFPVSMKTSEDFLFLLDYVQNTCKIGVADECCIYNYCDNPCGAVNNTKEQYLIDTIKIYHKIQAMMKNHSISYINEIENSIMERYYYIVYNLLRMGDNKKELRSILYTLNFDLKQMSNLDRKNKLKRFLVEHQCFSIIERSIKK
ncbi:glycosyltransferase family 2 protein [Gemmiger qucibialis]|uniref:glycosyltransferase family 2 protein n=1 Tax=Gemmiger qucibialis TaxID=2997294 RepID=UPI0022E52437|nr:glycosyltransferase [Gemmiger qucibialis]